MALWLLFVVTVAVLSLLAMLAILLENGDRDRLRKGLVAWKMAEAAQVAGPEE